MAFKPNTDFKLEKFDDVWSLGDPAAIELKFQELLPQAQALEDKSTYIQILTQIALAQALQHKFENAHKTLEDAQKLVTPTDVIAQARIALERGRVLQQEGKKSEARPYFEQSYNLSATHNLDYHTINAAHMIAIVISDADDKITWNQKALDLAEKTTDTRASLWLGSLYNNLGQNYLEKKEYQQALAAFKKALEYREKEGYAPNIRVAKWSIGRTLRSLEQLDDALEIQSTLLNEYAAITDSEKYDMPLDMFTLARGWVFEEIAEICQAKAQFFAMLAYEDLSRNEMFKATAPERLARLTRILE